jgi:hypothetical protein
MHEHDDSRRSSGPPRITRQELLVRAGATVGALSAAALHTPGRATAAAWPPVSAYDAEVPTAWFDLSLRLVETTPGYSPPVASRAFGYTGVALYEALVPGMPDRETFTRKLNDLPLPPPPRRPAHHWPTVANTALASTFRSHFPTTPPENLEAIDALERRFLDEARDEVPGAIYRRSVQRGRQIADHIFEWSRSDGGHEGYKNNFPPYDPPTGPGKWVPTPPDFLRGLQPYWGKNRPLFIPRGSAGSPGPPPHYSEEPGSDFYREGLEVYETDRDLTPEQKEIALFWADAAGTPTPPGHSISILTQIVRQLELRLDRAALAYALVGIALSDAFVCCWHTKYRDNLLRPVTYIRELFEEDWLPFIVTPPFPEYTSGHSVQSGAAAQVLTDLFGPHPFTDHTHDERGMEPRSFESFMHAAEEAAISRLYGGIHFRSAIERGVAQGIRLGKRIRALE